MAITAAGVVGLALALPGVMPVVTVLAAVYFLYLAWRIATAPPLTEGPPDRRPPALSGGVFRSLVNPKGYAAMAALFSGFALLPERPELDAAAKIVMPTAVVTAVSVAGSPPAPPSPACFRKPRANRAVNEPVWSRCWRRWPWH